MSTKRLRAIALPLGLALMILPGLTLPAVAELAKGFTFEKDYGLQSGLSLVIIPLTEDDRLQHVAAGSAISAFVSNKTGSFWKGCAAALAAGIVKEAYDEWIDRSPNGFEARDVGYTLAGCSFSYRF